MSLPFEVVFNLFPSIVIKSFDKSRLNVLAEMLVPLSSWKIFISIPDRSRIEAIAYSSALSVKVKGSLMKNLISFLFMASNQTSGLSGASVLNRSSPIFSLPCAPGPIPR